MCGRFAVTTDPALLAEKIQALDETRETREATGAYSAPNYSAPNYSAPNYSAPNYNVAPTTTISAVVKRHREADDEATRRVRSMRWGLVPPWVKTTADGAPDTTGPLLINARAEKVSNSPAFRNSARHKRCLVPMDGWYEWARTGEARGGKTPFYMSADDGDLLFMAGLWTTWRPEGSPRDTVPLLSCAIITTESAGPLAGVHDRMPLTVSAPDWDRWLDPDAHVDEGLLRGHGDLHRIAVREVSTLVNSVRNNGPELIEPAGPHAEQAGLF